MNFKFNNSFIFKDRRTKRKLKGEEDKISGRGGGTQDIRGIVREIKKIKKKDDDWNFFFFIKWLEFIFF